MLILFTRHVFQGRFCSPKITLNTLRAIQLSTIFYSSFLPENVERKNARTIAIHHQREQQKTLKLIHLSLYKKSNYDVMIMRRELFPEMNKMVADARLSVKCEREQIL